MVLKQGCLSVSHFVRQPICCNCLIFKFVVMCHLFSIGVTSTSCFCLNTRRKQPDWGITWRTRTAVNTKIGAGQVQCIHVHVLKNCMYRGVDVLHSQVIVNSRALGSVSLSKPIKLDLVTELTSVAFFSTSLHSKEWRREIRYCLESRSRNRASLADFMRSFTLSLCSKKRNMKRKICSYKHSI